LSNEKNTSNSAQETVTITTEDPKKIKKLEKQLEAKNEEIEIIKEKTITAIKKIKAEASQSNIETDLTKKIIKQNTFKHNYRNGYADGTVKKLKAKILADKKKAKAGTK